MSVSSQTQASKQARNRLFMKKKESHCSLHVVEKSRFHWGHAKSPYSLPYFASLTSFLIFESLLKLNDAIIRKEADKEPASGEQTK